MPDRRRVDHVADDAAHLDIDGVVAGRHAEGRSRRETEDVGVVDGIGDGDLIDDGAADDPADVVVRRNRITRLEDMDAGVERAADGDLVDRPGRSPDEHTEMRFADRGGPEIDGYVELDVLHRAADHAAGHEADAEHVRIIASAVGDRQGGIGDVEVGDGAARDDAEKTGVIVGLTDDAVRHMQVVDIEIVVERRAVLAGQDSGEVHGGRHVGVGGDFAHVDVVGEMIMGGGIGDAVVHGHIFDDPGEGDQVDRVGDLILVVRVVPLEAEHLRIGIRSIEIPPVGSGVERRRAGLEGGGRLADGIGVRRRDIEGRGADRDRKQIDGGIVGEISIGSRTAVDVKDRLDDELVDVGPVDDDLRAVVRVREGPFVRMDDAGGGEGAGRGADLVADAGVGDRSAVVDDEDVVDDAGRLIEADEVGGHVQVDVDVEQFERRVDEADVSDRSFVVGEHRIIVRDGDVDGRDLVDVIDINHVVVTGEIQVVDREPAAVEGAGEDVLVEDAVDIGEPVADRNEGLGAHDRIVDVAAERIAQAEEERDFFDGQLIVFGRDARYIDILVRHVERESVEFFGGVEPDVFSAGRRGACGNRRVEQAVVIAEIGVGDEVGCAGRGNEQRLPRIGPVELVLLFGVVAVESADQIDVHQNGKNRDEKKRGGSDEAHRDAPFTIGKVHREPPLP